MSTEEEREGEKDLLEGIRARSEERSHERSCRLRYTYNTCLINLDDSVRILVKARVRVVQY